MAPSKAAIAPEPIFHFQYWEKRMFYKLASMPAALILIALMTHADAAQDKKPRGGNIVGTVKGQKDTKDGKNTMIDVLAPGEEKARTYMVQWDPKIQAPMPHVLKAVRAAKVGDVVEFDWVDSNHGPMITTFKQFKKNPG
jgi:hypothetical protein